MLEAAIMEKLDTKTKAGQSSLGKLAAGRNTSSSSQCNVCCAGSAAVQSTLYQLFTKLGVSPKEKMECSICWE